MDPQAQPPVSFFAMATDKRNAEKAKVSRPIDQLNECRTAMQPSTRVRVHVLFTSKNYVRRRSYRQMITRE
jgi:Flp pilus assembly secretin CpaC